MSERIIQSRHYGRLIATLSSPSNSGEESMDFVDPYTQRVYALRQESPKQAAIRTGCCGLRSTAASIAQAKPLSYISSLLLVRRGTACH